jgi:hypothetical protein
VSNASGKIVIISIVVIALTAAGTSWWYRYSATSQSATFWGAQTAALIRDAPIVELYEWRSVPTVAFQSRFSQSYLDRANGRDISKIAGLTHLRNALLEDRSYKWPAEPLVPGSWGWVLVFRDHRGRAAILFFARDWTRVSTFDNHLLSCEPIAGGLVEMLGDLVPADLAR